MRLPLQTWSEQNAPPAPWWSWVLAAALLGSLVWLLVRGLRNRSLYRVEQALPPEDRKKVETAVAAAEKKTVGEIVPVVLGRSDRYPAADLWSGILFALSAFLATWALVPATSPPGLLLFSLGAGILGWAASRSFPELRRHFVAPWRAVELVEEQAFQEFFRLGLHHTAEKTGVLLFVSLFERRVAVLGDEGIDSKLDEEAWKEIGALVLRAAADGRLAQGMVAAVERMGEILAEHFPWKEGDRNELPNRVIVRNS